MTSMTRNQLYLLARAAAKGGAFKIEFSDRRAAIAFLCDVAGMPSSVWQPTQDAHYRDHWDLGDGYSAEFGIGALVVFSPTMKSAPGVMLDDCVLCTQCAGMTKGLPVTSESHPDGFTCADCGEVVNTAQ